MPGDLFVDSDYSQIELRLLAHMSGDEQLIEAFREIRTFIEVRHPKYFM